MNKWFGCIGAILFVAAVVLGKVIDFPNSYLIEIAIGAFGFASLFAGGIKKAKEEGTFNWKIVVCMALATVAGILVCLGGYSDNIFMEISSVVLAFISIILGIFSSKNK